MPTEEQKKQKAKSIYEQIVEYYNSLIGVDPIEDLTPECLEELIDDEFNRCGLNYIMVGDFNQCGVLIDPPEFKECKTSQTLQSIDEVKDLLNRKVEAYLRELEKTCQTYKQLIYNHLQAYQDEQNRKKQPNPYSK